jgi:1-acyl-sn-glycerol-3-phosphate acyltransferase
MKRKTIADFILNRYGWKVVDQVGYIPKCVICVAPHTSNFDLLMGQLAYAHLGRKASFLMKKSWFFFPLGNFFRAIGGIPVDRSKNNSLTQQIAKEFARREDFHVAITPEGTRKKTSKWKKGFYFIAQASNVPILLATIHYGKKTIELRQLFYPTGDMETDILAIKKTYTDVSARHPEKFVL